MMATTATMPRRTSRTKPPSSKETLLGGAKANSLQSALFAQERAQEHDHGKYDRDRQDGGRGGDLRVALCVEPRIEQRAEHDVRHETPDDRPHRTVRATAEQLAPQALVLHEKSLSVAVVIGAGHFRRRAGAPAALQPHA